MRFSFHHPAAPPRAVYDVVDSLLEADFAVVDADSKSAVKGIVQSGRVAHAVFVGSKAPEGALARLPRPIDPTRILRTLDEVTAQLEGPARVPSPSPTPSPTQVPTHVSAKFPAQLPAASPDASLAAPPSLAPAAPTVPVPGRPRTVPTLDDTVFYAPRAEALLAPAEALAALTGSRAPAPMAKADKRAAARSASRRARLAGGAAGVAPAEPLRDVLVLDDDTDASAALADLLERFGFTVHAVATVAQARVELAAQPFAAIFADIALDDSDGGAGLELLQLVHRMPTPPGVAAPAVLLVSAPLHPAERVIASLAGVGAPLAKPVTRGTVARALESRGVVLPADSRRV